MARLLVFLVFVALIFLEARAQPVNVGDRIHDSLTAGNGKWEASKLTVDTVDANVYIGAGSSSQDISDSITAFGRDTAQAAAFTGVYADSVNTPILRLYGAQFFLSDSPDFVTYKGNMIFNGGIGFFGKFPTVFAPCPLPYATPPNPVTEAQARAAYDLALQNCLDESGVNLVNTP